MDGFPLDFAGRSDDGSIVTDLRFKFLLDDDSAVEEEACFLVVVAVRGFILLLHDEDP